jgi:hypothetical protein
MYAGPLLFPSPRSPPLRAALSAAPASALTRAEAPAGRQARAPAWAAAAGAAPGTPSAAVACMTDTTQRAPGSLAPFTSAPAVRESGSRAPGEGDGKKDALERDAAEGVETQQCHQRVLQYAAGALRALPQKHDNLRIVLRRRRHRLDVIIHHGRLNSCYGGSKCFPKSSPGVTNSFRQFGAS